MGIAAAKRLQAISGLLEEAYLRSRDGFDNPRNLLLAYETSYAGDRWIRSLEASVALSERKYAEAVKIIESSRGAGVGTAYADEGRFVRDVCSITHEARA